MVCKIQSKIQLNTEFEEGFWLQLSVRTCEKKGRHAPGVHRKGKRKLQVQPKKQLY